MRYDNINTIFCKEITPTLFWEEWECFWDKFMRECYFKIKYASKTERFEEIIQSFRINLIANNYTDENEILGDLFNDLIIELNRDYKQYLNEQKLKDLEKDFV